MLFTSINAAEQYQFKWSALNNPAFTTGSVPTIFWASLIEEVLKTKIPCR